MSGRGSPAGPHRTECLPTVAERRLAVAMVCMPFASVWRPSIQLGTLAPIVRAAGHRVSTFHLQLDLAALIGPERYELFADFGREPVGDWLFTVEAFGSQAPDDASEEMLESPAAGELLRGLGWSRAQLLELRRTQVPRYFDWLDRVVAWDDYDVVGFTSTFQQNTASLALARRIAQRSSSTTVVFGGANLDGDMGLELLAISPWVDYAVVGEGEKTLPDLLSALSRDEDATGVPGVAGRRSGRVVAAVPRALTTRLDELPEPDYDEYFTRGAALRVLEKRPYELRLPFESSRGCWWGEKHHCTFCGLNGTTMMYRSKSPARVRAELAHLRERYGISWFDAVDNILDRSYFRSLLLELAGDHRPYRLFYEIKANLDEEEVDLLVRAGVAEVQPGIESLSSHVLELMNKGVSAAQNVEVLRWFAARNMTVHWNVLYGFPGETAEDYTGQVALMRSIHHLPPPESVGRIWMERFSPLFSARDQFPARELVPRSGYRSIYPAGTDFSRIAYFFDYAFADALPDGDFTELHEEVAAWRDEWADGHPPRLTAKPKADSFVISDGRWGPEEQYELRGDEAAVFRLLRSRRRTRRSLSAALAMGEDEREGAVESLLRRGVVATDGRFLVTLPV
jgi:ribosomal peptide maturation radical SAM protein 1